jgi:CheY-like chemotaxis protein
VQLTLAVENDSAVVSLRDTGIGFESSFAEKLFEPFVRHEQGRDRAAGGLGLGLAIVTIPIAPRLNDSPIDGGSVEQFGSRSVLVVEDNKDLADGVAELLRLHGVFVRVAYDGRSALKSALDAVPDIILCDLGLPGGMDGLAVARACRAEISLRNVRLVATSGYSSAEDHANATTAGFDSLIVKPLTEESLRTLIR